MSRLGLTRNWRSGSCPEGADRAEHVADGVERVGREEVSLGLVNFLGCRRRLGDTVLCQKGLFDLWCAGPSLERREHDVDVGNPLLQPRG